MYVQSINILYYNVITDNGACFRVTVLTWGVKLGYNPNTPHSGKLNDLLDVCLGVDMCVGVIGSLYKEKKNAHA